MYQRGDRVVYASHGVCIVSETDARTSFGGDDRPYYVLTPTRQHGGTVFVPVDHEECMRPVMGRDEAVALIESLPSIPIDDYKDGNSRAVEDHFRKILRKNDCAESARVAKTMRKRIGEQREKRRIPSSMYTRLLEQAELQVRSELAAALDIADDALDEFIASRKR